MYYLIGFLILVIYFLANYLGYYLAKKRINKEVESKTDHIAKLAEQKRIQEKLAEGELWIKQNGDIFRLERGYWCFVGKISEKLAKRIYN